LSGGNVIAIDAAKEEPTGISIRLKIITGIM